LKFGNVSLNHDFFQLQNNNANNGQAVNQVFE